MKNLIRISFAFLVALIVGIMLVLSVELRQTDLVAADDPAPPNSAARQFDRPLPPVAINKEQILLRTIVLEIDSVKMAKSGINFDPSLASPPRVPTKGQRGECSIVSPREARLFVKALTANGVAKILAEPTIITNNGRPARFHNGGEFPLLVTQDNDTASVEYRQFGTSIDFIPMKLAGDKLRLEIRVDQTDRDQTKSIKVKGAEIPGLRSRWIDTVIELELGTTAILHAPQLLVIVTPEVVAAPVETSTAPRTPRQVNEMSFKNGMDMSMIQGHASIVKFEHKIPKVKVASDGVIEVQIIDPYRVLVSAIKAGSTKLTVWDERDLSQALPIQVVGRVLPAPLRPAPRVRPPTGLPSITVTALIYSIEPKKLKDAGLDVRKALEDNEPAADVFVGGTANAIVSVIGPRSVNLLNQRLTKAAGADVVSRPQIRTISGEPAKIHIGSRVQLPGSGDVQQASGELQDVGFTLELLPTVNGDRLRLEARALNSQLKGKKVESISFTGAAELYPGETLAICRKGEESEQLLVLLTPVIDKNGATAASPPETPPRDLRFVQEERNAAEARLNTLRAHFGPHHPEILQQQQQLATLDRFVARQKAGTDDALRSSLWTDFGKTIQHAFPDAMIRLHPLPNGILLSGTVSDSQHVDVLTRIAENYFPQVINNLAVAQPSADRPKASTAQPENLQTVLDELFPGSNIKIHPLNSSVVLSGSVDSASTMQVIRVAEDYYPSVINHLTEVGAARKVPQDAPVNPVDAATPARQARSSIHHELHELRQEVKVLRRDVGRLIEFLQEDADKTSPREPPSSDARSSKDPAETDDPLWALIGIRAAPTEVEDSRYRGGLKVSEVRPASPAADAEIRLGDVLVGLGKWETVDRANVVFVLDHIDLNHVDRLKFYVLRGKETRFGHLKLPTQPTPTIDASQGNAVRPAVSEPIATWELSLDEVVEIALRNAKSIRNVGAVVADDSRMILMPINADVDFCQFEAVVRNLLSDVEAAYWDVWVSHREVETIEAARDTAQKLWHETSERKLAGEDKSQAEVKSREQYFAARSQLEASRKKLNNSENTLRFLIGIASTDGRLIRPTDQPATLPLKFNWKTILADALANAPELRQHRSVIRSLELELTAAKKALPLTFTQEFESVGGKAFANTSPPVGHRREMTRVRYLELRLARDTARVKDIELNISHSLSEAIRRVDFNLELRNAHFNRQQAARSEAELAAVAYKSGRKSLDMLLEVNRRVTQSTLETDEATRQFAVAAMHVRFLRGLLPVDRGIRIMEVALQAADHSRDVSSDQATSPRIPDPTVALQPNDRLTIESLTDNTINRNVTILSDGTITLPRLGQVAAAGLSLERQREHLESLYKKYYRSPNLTLSFYGTSVPVNADTRDSVPAGSDSAPDPSADLKPGDRLMLEFSSESGLNRSITVLADGTVTLPLLGQVPAAGRTLAALNEQLIEHYKEHFRNAQCTLSFLGTSLPAR